jgi:hypothetical protein
MNRSASKTALLEQIERERRQASLFSYSDHGLFTPVTVAIADLMAEQAARVPAERFNCVWAVVTHVRFW